MRILITGGNGLVGRNIREALSARHDILAPSRQELDLLEYGAVETYLIETKPDMIIHCAGLVGGIQANIREPVRFLVENLELGKNIVLAAAKASVERLLNMGSSCMYPRAAPNPLREDMILQGELEPTNEGYAIAKIAVQRLCHYTCSMNPALQYKTLIPCNLYGKWDKFDPQHSHMIPAVIRKIHEAKETGQQSVDIWGTGQARREFMYAGDLASFVLFAVEHFDAIPEVINVGLGHDHTIDDYYRTVASVIGYHGQFLHDTSKPEGMERKLIDVSLLNDLGWKADTSLKAGIQLTYEYFLEQEKRK